MGKKVKKVGITTNITEYKSLEKYLENMSRKGFELSGIDKEVFKFERKEPRKLDFMIRLICNEGGYDYTNEDEVKKYIELYKYRGWNFCASNDMYQVFYKEKSMIASPIPIYIERRQEYKNIKKVFIKYDVKKIIGMIISILLAAIPFLEFTYKDLFSSAVLIVVMVPFLLTLGLVIRYIPAVIWFIKNRINLILRRDLSFSPNIIIQTRMKLIRSYSVVVLICLIVWLSGVGNNVFMKLATNNQEQQAVVLNLTDFGETIEPANKWTDNKTSVWVPVNVKYYEYIGKSKQRNGIKEVSTIYIRAINKLVADYIFDGFVKESSKGINKYEEKARVWNVDRGYYLSELKSKIIIQKDNYIYILEGSFDFSNKEIVEICEEKLGV